MYEYILYSVVIGSSLALSYRLYREIKSFDIYKTYAIGYLRTLNFDNSNKKLVIFNIENLIDKLDKLPRNGWINGNSIVLYYRKIMIKKLLKVVDDLENDVFAAQILKNL